MDDWPQAKSISELMDLDEAGRVGDGAGGFDDQLWGFVSGRFDTPDHAAASPEPVWVYLASRWLEWEVGNGGFAQAAYNIPDWFELAEKGYRKLGLDAAADLIAEAREMVSDGAAEGFTSNDIGELFGQFSESDLAELSEDLDEVGWWAEKPRLAYVRKHRAAFRTLDERC